MRFVGAVLIYLHALLAFGQSDDLGAPPSQKAGWKITEFDAGNFLFERSKDKMVVLLAVEGVPFSDEEAASYILSNQFFSDGKRSRADSFSDARIEGPSVTVRREKIADRWVGITETEIRQNDDYNVIQERWFVRSGYSFHLLISAKKPSDNLSAVAEEFQSELGLESKVSAVERILKNLIAEASASSELRQNGSRQPTAPARQPVAQPESRDQTIRDCRAQADEVGIRRGLTRSGPPTLHPAPALRPCLEGAKKYFGGIGNSAVNLMASGDQRLVGNSAQLGCPLQPLRYDSVSGNISSSLARLQSLRANPSSAPCKLAATAMTALQTQAQQTFGLIRGSLSALYYASPIGQALAARRVYEWRRQQEAPLTAVYALIQKKWAGFGCLNDAEQTKFACKIATDVAANVALTVATMGGSAAMRARRVAQLLDEAIEALEVGTRATQRRAALRVAALELSPSELGTAAGRALGRRLSASEIRGIQAAQRAAESSTGAYTRAELRAKLEELKRAGITSRAERERLLRSGLVTKRQLTPAQIALAFEADTETVRISDSIQEARSRIDVPAGFTPGARNLRFLSEQLACRGDSFRALNSVQRELLEEARRQRTQIFLGNSTESSAGTNRVWIKKTVLAEDPVRAAAVSRHELSHQLYHGFFTGRGREPAVSFLKEVDANLFGEARTLPESIDMTFRYYPNLRAELLDQLRLPPTTSSRELLQRALAKEPGALEHLRAIRDARREFPF